MITDKTINALQTAMDRLASIIPTEVTSYINGLDERKAVEFVYANLPLFTRGYTNENNSYSEKLYQEKDFGIKYKGKVIPNKFDFRNKGLRQVGSANMTSNTDWKDVSSIFSYRAALKTDPAEPTGAYRTPTHNSTPVTYLFVYGYNPQNSQKEDEDIVRRNVRSYSQAINDNYDYRLFSAYYLRTNEKPELEWLSAFTRIVTIDELEKVGKEYRSEVAREAALNKKAPIREKEIHYSIVTDSKGNHTIPKLIAPIDIEKATKVVAIYEPEKSMFDIPGAATRDKSWWDRYSRFLGQDFRKEKPNDPMLSFAYDDVKMVLSTIARALPDTLVIILPKSRSFSPIKKANPNALTLTGYINKKIEEAKTEQELEDFLRPFGVLLDVKGRNAMIDFIGKNHGIDQIKNDTTREIFSIFYEQKEAASLAFLVSMFYNFKAKNHKQLVETVTSFSHQRMRDLKQTRFLHEKNVWWDKYSILNGSNAIDEVRLQAHIAAINALSEM